MDLNNNMYGRVAGKSDNYTKDLDEEFNKYCDSNELILSLSEVKKRYDISDLFVYQSDIDGCRFGNKYDSVIITKKASELTSLLDIQIVNPSDVKFTQYYQDLQDNYVNSISIK